LDKGTSIHPELENLFKAHFGRVPDCTEALSAHGSDRTILRLKTDDETSAIGIMHDNVAENKAFIGLTLHFQNNKLNVPEIYKVSPDYKYYLMEDLGDKSLSKLVYGRSKHELSDEIISLYKTVINELLKFQVTAGEKIDYSLCYQFDKFGEENIDYDLNYFKERFVEMFYRGKLCEKELNSDLNYIKMKILEVPANYFLYRDFQSRNIMLINNVPYFIDYQSGRKGALHYDLASLLYDARADIPQPTRELLIEYYIQQAESYVKLDRDKFIKEFWYFALVRILQAMGAYGFLSKVKGKSNFLESVPYAVKNINTILNEKIGSKNLCSLRNLFKELEDGKTYN
jgi:aminoglycoside/choline kinase family phosphotransferase